jgi:hypothetical protein
VAGELEAASSGSEPEAEVMHVRTLLEFSTVPRIFKTFPEFSKRSLNFLSIP